MGAPNEKELGKNINWSNSDTWRYHVKYKRLAARLLLRSSNGLYFSNVMEQILRHPSMKKKNYDKLGNWIDVTSHSTHAMNPIDRTRFEDEDWEFPDARHEFSCMFCGALDDTPKAKAPCPWGAPDRD